MNLFHKLKHKWMYILSLASILSGTIIVPLNAYAADESPKDWPKWTQMDTSQPWNTSKGWGPPINPGCYVTSAAIQGARSGITKTNGGKEWNPLNINGGSPLGQQSYNGGKYTFKMKDHAGNFGGDLNGAPAMGKGAAKKAIAAFQKKGEFPIIHISQAAGYGYGTHYAAVRKLSGDSLSMYDPARSKSYNTTDYLKKNGKNWLTAAAWIEGWGGGPKDFNQAPAPAAGSADSSAKGGDSSKGSKGGSNAAPKIKPIFNPFTTPTANNTAIGYDTEEKNGATDRGTRLAFYEYLGPKIVSWIQVLAIALMLIFLGWIIVIALFMLADRQLGGLVSEHMNDKYRKVLMPYESGTQLYGTGVVKEAFLSMFLTVLICGLVLTDTLPLILGQVFFWLSNLF